ncbi:MAG: hypothetical protein K6A23_15585 [Butyrivibrio sp.]|nr:hypothetical protein [Butyrivibrio sp.]
MSRDYNEKRKFAAAVMAVFMLVVVLFSAFFVAIEMGHDCSGEDCPICHCIQQCENTLHHIAGGMVLQAEVILPVIFFILTVSFLTDELYQQTLISQKVRMND